MPVIKFINGLALTTKNLSAFSNVEVNCILLGSDKPIKTFNAKHLHCTCNARGTLNSRSTRAAHPNLIFKISAVEHVACFALSTMFILSLFSRL